MLVPTSNLASRPKSCDAVIVGSGPNGLAAAISLAREGLKVHVIEGGTELGGGTRTAELTLPGCLHDVCSTAHPMGLLSPFFRSLELEKHGLKWVHPEIPAAHALDGGEAVFLHRSVEQTAEGLGRDAAAYRLLFESVSERLPALCPDLLGPPRFPREVFDYLNFGVRSLPPASLLARTLFREPEARALFAGNAAHSILPLSRFFTSAIGVTLMAAAHAVGWPLVQGGSRELCRALSSVLEMEGGTWETGQWVESLDQLPKAKAYLFDTSPAPMTKIVGDRFPERYSDRLDRFEHGPGSFKLDLVLSAPMPWTNSELAKAGTVHLGGPLEEVEESERACWQDRVSDKPFALLVQPTQADPSRAPRGKHIVWAYCHVPSGYQGDCSNLILDQMERFAPGTGELILASHQWGPSDFENYNPNYLGGDIIGGAAHWKQLLTRPTPQRDPYATAAKEIFLCSASTPPGGGVHGMCGAHAARSVLRKVFGIKARP